MRRWVISQQRGAFFTRGGRVFVCRSCSAPFFPVFHDMSKRQFCMIFHGFHHKKLGVEINERVQQNLRGMGTQLFGFLEKKRKIKLSTVGKIVLKGEFSLNHRFSVHFLYKKGKVDFEENKITNSIETVRFFWHYKNSKTVMVVSKKK